MAPKSHYPIIKLEAFDGCDGLLIKDVAAILGRSVWTVTTMIKKYGIRDRFPKWGGQAVQLSRRGYNGLYERDCKH
jgi:hypothetical protein